MISALAYNVAFLTNSPRFDKVLFVRRASKTHSLFRFLLVAVVLTGLPSYAQSPPPSQTPNSASVPLAGFLPTDEVKRIVRDAGFTPLGPARHEGAIYEVRVTDYRDVLMRVVIDARSGVIRAVNRIVPLEPDGIVGMLPPSGELAPKKAAVYEALSGLSPSQSTPHDLPQDHAMPPDIGGTSSASKEDDLTIQSMPSTTIGGTFAGPDPVPPLPRPRPSDLTLQRAKTPGKVPRATRLNSSAAYAPSLIPQVAAAPATATPKKHPPD
jgi:hypothetical protein